MWLFVFDGGRLLCSCFWKGLNDRGSLGLLCKTSD